MEGLLVYSHEVKAALDRGEPIVFLDVRSPASWAASDRQLPGATRLPLAEVEARAGDLPHEQELIAYCT